MEQKKREQSNTVEQDQIVKEGEVQTLYIPVLHMSRIECK